MDRRDLKKLTHVEKQIAVLTNIGERGFNRIKERLYKLSSGEIVFVAASTLNISNTSGKTYYWWDVPIPEKRNDSNISYFILGDFKGGAFKIPFDVMNTLCQNKYFSVSEKRQACKIDKTDSGYKFRFLVGKASFDNDANIYYQHAIDSLFLFPDEVTEIESELSEGQKKQVYVNVYERNPESRKQCIEHYGSDCYICGFNSSVIYGDEFVGKIHVHHIKPLSEIGEEYKVDPINDLVPVCPNCHMILHNKTGDCYAVDEIKRRINKK